MSDIIYDHMTIYYKMALLGLPSVAGHVTDVNIHLHTSSSFSSLKGLYCFFPPEICFNDVIVFVFSPNNDKLYCWLTGGYRAPTGL